GMQQMADTVAEKIPITSLRTNTAIDSLNYDNRQWLASFGGESERFDAVILAIPAHEAASLMQTLSSEMAEKLLEIPYSSSITVAIGFDRARLASLPRGFGL